MGFPDINKFLKYQYPPNKIIINENINILLRSLWEWFLNNDFNLSKFLFLSTTKIKINPDNITVSPKSVMVYFMPIIKPKMTAAEYNFFSDGWARKSAINIKNRFAKTAGAASTYPGVEK